MKVCYATAEWSEPFGRKVLSSVDETFVPRVGDFVRLGCTSERGSELYEVVHVELIHMVNEGTSHAEVLLAERK